MTAETNPDRPKHVRVQWNDEPGPMSMVRRFEVRVQGRSHVVRFSRSSCVQNSHTQNMRDVLEAVARDAPVAFLKALLGDFVHRADLDSDGR